MDNGDVAQEREQLDRDLALAALHERLRGARAAASRSTDCEGCSEPIDARRLAALPGAIRCVECQQRWEKHGV